MRRLLTAGLILGVLGPALAGAVPLAREPRLHPGRTSALPSFVQRVLPAIVGLSVRVAEESPTAARLGTRRFGSGVLFDPRGYALTVSYVVLDASAVEARTHDRGTVGARVIGIDFDSGLAVVKLDGDRPWPVAVLGQSQDVATGMLTGTVGLDEDGDLVHVTGSVQSVRRFSASWEYMLERAFIVAPASPAWGGSALVDARGEVVGITSLRLGEAPHVNLAIPLERFLPVKDELVSLGRVASRPVRPWLGIYTIGGTDGVIVDGVSPLGPARAAGFVKGDRIVKVNGVAVGVQEEFYRQLWRGRAGDVFEISIVRGGTARTIPVRSIDRRQLYRTSAQ